MDQLGNKPKGILAPFKNDDGSFKSWAPLILIIAIIFFARDIINLTTGSNVSPEYEAEMEVLKDEILELGNFMLDENTELENFTANQYEYKFPGTKLIHEFLTGAIESEKQTAKEIEDIKERSLLEIDLAELNDPKVVEEVRSAHQQEVAITINGLKENKEWLIIMAEKISAEHKMYPDDDYLTGMYKSFNPTENDAQKLNDNAADALDAFYKKLDKYFVFLSKNTGKYEYYSDNQVWVDPSIETEYDNITADLDDAGIALDEAKATYATYLSSKMQSMENI